MNNFSTAAKCLFCKLCLVGGPVLEYIEWNVILTQVKIFDTIEMICVVEWFESCWHIILLLTQVNPLNTIYQIIYFNIPWVCRLLVYTCKPLLYTNKIWMKGVISTVSKIGCVEVHIPIFILHDHFTLSKKLCLNKIQTIQLCISF